VVAAKRGGLLSRGLSAGALRRGGVEGTNGAGIEEPLQRGGAAGEDDAGERTFAEANPGLGAGGGYEERTEEGGEVRVVADNEEILAFGVFAKESLKVFEGGFGGERGGVQDLGFVASLGADERCGLEAALEGAGDDQIELDVQRIQHVSELEAVLLAFFIERAFEVEQRIGAWLAGAGVAKNVQIHSLFTF
jgi:hypothetical protein